MRRARTLTCIAGLAFTANGCGTPDDSQQAASGGTSGSAGSGGGSGGQTAVTTGGATASGGTASGGTTATGGTGSGGIPATGGTPGGGSGGISASGGSGGRPTATAACALSSDRIRITEVDVGGTVVNNEDEAALKPLTLSALPSGGSRLAWMGNDDRVHITTLDSADQVTGVEVALPANDFADLYADDSGGVVLLSRDAKGSGAQHCGTLTNLCGNASSLPSQYECWDMYMVRFDGTTETWATQLTESSPELPPYLNGPTDTGRVIYVWQAYAHHGRIAFDGTNYAGYFGAAISVSQTCVQPDTTLQTGVNIHQGDRMQVVGPTGELLTDHQSFDWGCSHSGYERILWDPVSARFVPVCKTDNENRIALAPQYSTIRSIDLAASNLGDLVLGSGGGYWLSASDQEPSGTQGSADVFLLRFDISADTATLRDELPVASTPALNERAPHVAAYGTDGLVVAWETSDAENDIRRDDATRTIHVQARARDTGASLGEPLTVQGILGNRYQEFRAYPDGSVAFPAPGSTASTVKILRILPCGG